MLEPRVGRRQPLAFDDAGRSDACFGCLASSSCGHVEREQELTVANAAFLADDRAVAGCEQDARRSRRPAARDAIGIAREQRAAERRFVDRTARAVREALKRVGDASHVPGQIAFALDRAEQIARRRRPLSGCGGNLELTLREHGTGERGFAGALRREQDRREPGIERQALHAAASIVQPAVRRRAEAVEQIQRGAHAVEPRRLEPLERGWISAPREHVEHRARDIDALDLRFAMRPQTIGLAPHPHDHSRTDPSGAPGPLVRGVLRNAFGLEAVDGAIGIVPGDLLETRVDDGVNARDREGRFRDVRRENHPPGLRRLERAVLRGGVERTMELDDLRRRAVLPRGAQLTRGAGDFPGARQKAQHLPLRRAKRGIDGGGHRRARHVADIERVQGAGNVDDRAPVEKRRHR